MVTENRGTGIATINHAFAEALLAKPIYTSKISRFTVTFSRRLAAPSERYATGRDKVLAQLKSSSSASTSEIVNATHLSRTAVQKAINQLIKEGKALRTEPLKSPLQRYKFTSLD